ncbi:mannonate dehydratase [Roseinatronobacter sp. S2]|uniref:mannonate dehydratase n=1 Tax=Roseinatronobacter sp. S2 TaxID=3035471 RepID=UPI00240FEAAD|nr:mannonate dehydratase [Roseinatronobacter sp. S2]WFE73348.1 mannonate dehydratase [Roseinatronobacter sp. S2]
MRYVWRWFGPPDAIGIDEIRQVGVSGIVSALHHFADGMVWPSEEITRRQKEISQRPDGTASGLEWAVVESLPVSEDIKRQTGDWRHHIENYKISLKNLASAGIATVCYNFMPMLDWTRTDLRAPAGSGARCMRYDAVDFAAFDLLILKRSAARAEYSEDVAEAARTRLAKYSEAQKTALVESVLAGLPGAANALSLDTVRAQLAEYDRLDATGLRSHLIDFLTEVVPTAEALGIRLCCHPDDPPFPLLGLPRVMSTRSDMQKVLDGVHSPANGLTLCSGSLGARADSDLVGMVEDFGARIHFLHLRNVRREGAALGSSFYESAHLEGDVDMVGLIAAILAEEQRRRKAGRADWEIPMRPDHGQEILEDLTRGAQPGYPLIGRLKGLAELKGAAAALEYERVAAE